MTFRTRLFVAILAAALVPLAVLAFGVRREMGGRLSAEYNRRVEALIGVTRDELSARSRTVAERLATLASDLAADNRFRLAMRDENSERRWLLDYAEAAMPLAGLDMLQVQDDAGRILSSGHFRNEYGRLAPELPRLLSLTPAGTALVRARTAGGRFVALARVDSFRVGGARFTLIGGVRMDSAAIRRLAGGPDLTVRLVVPGSSDTNQSSLAAAFPFPFIDDAAGGAPVVDTAQLVVIQDRSALAALQQSVDRWFLVALGATAIAAVLLAAWLAARVSRPLHDLAEKTAALDLDRLDQEFVADRDDEIGRLARLLGAMTARLRTSAARLREAERRATVGDLSRQVNHDIKNGLAPIRHVLRHLGQVARDEPDRLPAVFAERRGTLESSVEYLESLARNYARLSPALNRDHCDVNALVREVARNADAGSGHLLTRLDDQLPAAAADAVVLRRILENLVGNAVDALESRQGTVTVITEAANQDARPAIRVTVADTGRGMTRAELERAFDDFHTTKPGGTGLGLSVVRRLVADLGGTLRVETEHGVGSRFIVELPVQPS